MKNMVGTPARGQDFFPRERQIERITECIGNGNNLQIAAPRRVGKTSILFYLQDNDVDGHVYVYVDTEHIEDENLFYRELLQKILKAAPVAKSTRLRRLFEGGNSFFSKIKSIRIMGHGLDFHESEEKVSYYDELTNFLSGLDLEKGRKLVLLIDEFPQTILNILTASNGDKQKATRFLKSNRALRLNPEINGKVYFIYTGSIGLNHTVAAIDATAFVNDLNSIEVEPLDEEEAGELVARILTGKKFKMEAPAVAYLLQKIDWLIPFHIQLTLQEIGTVCSKARQTIATEATIDAAFERMISQRNNSHFEHYYSRLKSQFKGDAFDYVDAVLQKLATQGTIAAAELYNLAAVRKVNEQQRQIIDILVYDGYINNLKTPSTFRFNSPVLRAWWLKFICK